MMGHLGSRTSALLDGQLSPDETERAWEHVHACHACRDLVEREGWVKTRLAGLSFDVASPSTPAGLKGSLIGAHLTGPPGDAYLAMPGDQRRRGAGMAMIGGGAVGAAVMGVLVFGVAPADAPTIDRGPASINRTATPSAPLSSPGSAVNLVRSGKQQR
ncbi:MULTISPECIES: zf-HC2 domain-containing protein [unclassified Nocardioides]|uniref:zf-HC2 domain-containing protein n=1 Tax=unclassified Nocardioides TaxID=2615069 RepID=UPI001A98F8E2|nr:MULTISPECIES: zf-HC2 domain-containing protein [unclassified Nocardioides]